MAKQGAEGEKRTQAGAPGDALFPGIDSGPAVGPESSGGPASSSVPGSSGASSAGESPAIEVRFEEALARLEELVGRLEVGELPLEETIETFEEGQRLLRICTDLLNRAELRVKEILRRADGTLLEREFSDDRSASDSRAESAGMREKQKPAPQKPGFRRKPDVPSVPQQKPDSKEDADDLPF